MGRRDGCGASGRHVTKVHSVHVSMTALEFWLVRTSRVGFDLNGICNCTPSRLEAAAKYVGEVECQPGDSSATARECGTLVVKTVQNNSHLIVEMI